MPSPEQKTNQPLKDVALATGTSAVVAASIAENTLQPHLVEKLQAGTITSQEFFFLEHIVNHIGNATEALYLLAVLSVLNFICVIGRDAQQNQNAQQLVERSRQGLEAGLLLYYILAVIDAETLQLIFENGTADPADIPFSLFAAAIIGILSNAQWKYAKRLSNSDDTDLK